ncbi:MAG: hypothetical protein ACRENE_20390 [Polyangiaceae bacterium]
MVRRPPTAWLLALGWLGVGCLSPTLPLPPPAVPTQQMLSSTQVRLTSDCGGVQNDAQVLVRNVTEAVPGSSQIGDLYQATACGSWSATVFAKTNDIVVISQQTDTNEGLPLTVRVGTP